jgi:hypothetical protein
MMLERVISDLRERRLWPLAVVMLVAIVAVPLVLAKTPAPVPPAPAPVAAVGASVRPALPSVTVGTTTSRSALNAKPYNPFTPSKQAKSASTTATAVVSSATNLAASKASAGASGNTTTSSSTGTSPTGSPGTVPGSPVKIPPGHAKPAPVGLRPDQAYEVTLAATRADGGLDTTPSLERLSAVPRPAQPLLVELGVLTGGRRVLFAVLPGTNISGPGRCIPGSVDCEVLALGVNQVETVWGSNPSTATEFAVTAIGAGTLPTRAAAMKVRTATSAQGRALLAASGLIAPNTMFSYDANLGAIVDLRNLVGGN